MQRHRAAGQRTMPRGDAKHCGKEPCNIFERVVTHLDASHAASMRIRVVIGTRDDNFTRNFDDISTSK
jgi:hypothetical protein